MTKDAIITLSIDVAGPPGQGVFIFDVTVDGELISSKQRLSPDESKALREISHIYGKLFEQWYCGGVRRPLMKMEEQSEISRKLYDLWLASSWEKIRSRVPVGGRRLLVVASDLPEVLNLPWEMLRPPQGDFLGIDTKVGIRRFSRSRTELPPFRGTLRPRPLRLLFAASAPKGEASLDYEREEEYLNRAISGLDVAFDSGDMGTIDELRMKIDQFKPHVVHLSGHGIVGKKCPKCGDISGPEDSVCRRHSCREPLDGVHALGYFAFEDERGETDLRSSEEIRRRFEGRGVQCVFVSGCQTGKAPPVEAMGGICQGLSGGEIPLTIGWAASIADPIANHFARVFYRSLASGQPADLALSEARQEVWEACKDDGDLSWSLPILYSATDQDLIFDPDPLRRVEPERPNVVQDSFDGIGYALNFVGRRREQQRLLPGLRDGSILSVIITGMGGSGKSTLATRLGRKLEQEDFTVIPIPSSEKNPLSSARILEACRRAFRDAARRFEAKGRVQQANELKIADRDLENPQIPEEERLKDLVSVLNRGRFILFLDNFESNIHDDTRQIKIPVISEFYRYLLGNISGGSRVIITSRRLPADLPVLPPKSKEEALGDFSEATFLKFLRRDEIVEGRFDPNDLSMELLHDLYRLFGGTPRFLEQIRTVLRDIPASELAEELSKVKLPSGDDPGELQRKRDEYCDKIFTSTLYSSLGSPGSQIALSRAAVYGISFNIDALAAVTGEPAETLRGFLREWQNHAFAYPDAERAAGELWAVYGLLRGWLLAQIGPDDRKAAHKAAGNFLTELNEQDREGELGLFWADCLLEARAQYLQSGDYDRARGVTDRLSGFFMRIGLYDDVSRLNEELLGYEEHPAPMNWIGRASLERADYPEASKWYLRALDAAGESNKEEEFLSLYSLATIDLRRGEYDEARQKFETALKILQQIGDRGGEAATWHQLASIDLNRGEYDEARQKFETSLKIKQQIGDRAGEAATFFQLGQLAAKQGRLAEGTRLVALCYMIDASIGHGDIESDLQSLSKMASQLQYTQEQLDAMHQEVAESYRRDRGRSLIDAAFGED